MNTQYIVSVIYEIHSGSDHMVTLLGINESIRYEYVKM